MLGKLSAKNGSMHLRLLFSLNNIQTFRHDFKDLEVISEMVILFNIFLRIIRFL